MAPDANDAKFGSARAFHSSSLITTLSNLTMADADVKLTTVSKGGADMGTVVPSDALSKTEGKVPAASGVGLGIHHALYTRSLLRYCLLLQTSLILHQLTMRLYNPLLLMAQILHQLIGSLSHYLQGFIHPRWCRISSINSMDILMSHYKDLY